MKHTFDVAIVGGGVAGLAAAAYLGRAGLAAVVIEKGSELGGRARTASENGFFLNLGPHAVYRSGPAWRALQELSVSFSGRAPKVSGTLAIARSAVHTMPVGLVSLVTTGLMPLSAKLELSRLMTAIDRVEPEPLLRMSALEWVERMLATEGARGVVKNFLRVATYTGELDLLSAGAAIEQLQHVLKHGVLYLDEGWQTLVDGLKNVAIQAGATIRSGNGAKEVLATNDGVSIVLHDSSVIRARAAVLAVGPRAAAALVPTSRALSTAAEQAHPVKVSVLDVALSKLPRPRAKVAFGTDEPLYFSVHSATAKLAPEGGAVVHAMRYGADMDAHAAERQLEGVMDMLQPGWREVVVTRRFLPAMIASNDLVSASRGGTLGRPGVQMADTPGLFIAGDWVGQEGILLDCALSSARQAATQCAAHLLEAPKGTSESSGQARGIPARLNAGAHHANVV